jgi:hypothetical protein
LDRISPPPNQFGSENQQAILSATFLLGCHPNTTYVDGIDLREWQSDALKRLSPEIWSRSIFADQPPGLSAILGWAGAGV